MTPNYLSKAIATTGYYVGNTVYNKKDYVKFCSRNDFGCINAFIKGYAADKSIYVPSNSFTKYEYTLPVINEINFSMTSHDLRTGIILLGLVALGFNIVFDIEFICQIYKTSY